MPYFASAVEDLNEDKLARETLQRRLNSDNPRSRRCWSGVRLKFPLSTAAMFMPAAPIGWVLAANANGKWPGHYACSVGLNDTDSLHAERRALEQMATAVGALNFNRANTHGNVSGAALLARGVTVVKIYTDLPACQACRNWLGGIAGHIVIRHLHCHHFTDYYAQDADKDDMWNTFLNEYAPQ